jgi:phage gp46-like protein
VLKQSREEVNHMKNKFGIISVSALLIPMIVAVVLTGCSKGSEATSTSSTPSPTASQPSRGTGIGMLSFLGMSLDELNTSLQEAVQQGMLTEQQANSVRAWWQEKPDFLNESLFPRTTPSGAPSQFSPSPSGSEPPRAMGIGMLSFLGQSLDELSTSLREAVQQGTLTEQQTISVRAWWQEKPDFLNESLFPRITPGSPPATEKVQ